LVFWTKKNLATLPTVVICIVKTVAFRWKPAGRPFSARIHTAAPFVAASAAESGKNFPRKIKKKYIPNFLK
jgi:hypothetical protein